MEKVQKEIAKMLLDIKAVKVKTNPPFKWSTGLLAPIYCDNRMVISYPKERALVISSFKKVIEENNIKFDVLAGTATAAIPWAAFLSWELNKPMVYVRVQRKDYGASKQVEGYMPGGSRVLIVEDLISTGRSSLMSAHVCQKEYNAEIVGFLAIFNYEMKRAKESFARNNFKLFPLSNFSTLIDVASENSYLSKEEKKDALAWSENPDLWHKEHGGGEILTINKKK